MKFCLCLAVAFVVLVVVSSESCHNVNECQHTSCDSQTNLGCSHGECTCLESPQSAPCAQTDCATRSECSTCTCNSNRQHHCFDGHCTCGFGGIGK